MNCPKCNQPVDDGATFCGNCGQPIQASPTPQPETSPDQNNVAPAVTTPPVPATPPVTSSPVAQVLNTEPTPGTVTASTTGGPLPAVSGNSTVPAP